MMEELIALLTQIMDQNEARIQDFGQILKLQEANARMREVLDKKQSKMEEIESLKKRIEEMRDVIENLMNDAYNPEERELLRTHYGV